MSSEFKVALLGLAAYYDKPLTDQQIIMYSDQVSRLLSVDEMKLAAKLYIDDPKNEFFPRPVSKLVELIRKPVSTEDLSQNVVSLLLQAERKFGVHWTDGYFQGGETLFTGKQYSYRTWAEAAISFFGEVGLQIVDRYGGWKNFCMTIYESPDGVIRAQVKNLTTSLQNSKERVGNFDALPNYSRSNNGLTSMGQLIEMRKNETENKGEK